MEIISLLKKVHKLAYVTKFERFLQSQHREYIAIRTIAFSWFTKITAVNVRKIPFYTESLTQNQKKTD